MSSPPEGARRTGRFVAVCLDPDYCWTPRGGKKKLVPYMIACDLSKSTHCSENTFFAGDPVFLHSNSLAPSVSGNEPGVGAGAGSSGIDGRGDGGLLSGINNGAVWIDQTDRTVFVNGIAVVRHFDACWMNHKPGS